MVPAPKASTQKRHNAQVSVNWLIQRRERRRCLSRPERLVMCVRGAHGAHSGTGLHSHRRGPALPAPRPGRRPAPAACPALSARPARVPPPASRLLEDFAFAFLLLSLRKIKRPWPGQTQLLFRARGAEGTPSLAPRRAPGEVSAAPGGRLAGSSLRSQKAGHGWPWCRGPGQGLRLRGWGWGWGAPKRGTPGCAPLRRPGRPQTRAPRTQQSGSRWDGGCTSGHLSPRFIFVLSPTSRVSVKIKVGRCI